MREGEFGAVGAALAARDPVVHLDADSEGRGHARPVGHLFRPGLGGGVAIGGLPVALDPECEIDPYGPSHPELGMTDREFDDALLRP